MSGDATTEARHLSKAATNQVMLVASKSWKRQGAGSPLEPSEEPALPTL